LSTDTPPPDDSEGQPEEKGRLIELPIEEELKESYLTYAMSVIVSRALPDVRDGLKPSQRRILMAMNDLNLSPSGTTSKCAGIVGETMKRYHPHGDGAIYPTLVRMAQDWATRYTLLHKQGNFGSIAGLPPAAMRYTEARMSAIAALMLDDIKLDTVDFTPTYDEKGTEPVVLPSRFPNLLVNGSSGIAVGMATSIPPHNLGEICDAIVQVIDEPDVSIDELLEIVQGPDFPTGGVICGRAGIRRGYHTGRSTVTVRGKAAIEEKKGRNRIVITEIPYMQQRDRVEERIAALVNDGRIAGISGIRNESDLNEPVRLVIELKRDADPDVVLNQIYQYSPLQDTFSIILLALIDGKPRVMSLKQMIDEFIRHRATVIHRRTQFLLSRARKRKHTIEGLLLALADIDKIIKIIRSSKTQAEAKQALGEVECPAAMMKRALGDEGFALFQEERGASDVYKLTAVQADAILKMTLGQLVNLEQERLGDEHKKLLEEIRGYLHILSDEAHILAIIKEESQELKRKHADKRRTEISGDEIGNIDLEDLITEETMVVTISHNGYIKRTPASMYRAQRRGGKGLKGAATEDEDPIEHLFVASTHAYLLFFTNKGKVHWQKVYGLPQLRREARGRAIVNLLNLADGEKIADCRAVRDFDLPGHFLLMATRKGLIKKTALDKYSRPKKGGIIAIKLRDDDELTDVVVTKPGDEVVLSTAAGMAIRFRESDARSMGRNTSGVKGIGLSKGDYLVGLVVADPTATLLTVCQNGYGKRTPFGPNAKLDETDGDAADGNAADGNAADGNAADGNAADGNAADGNAADGNAADGNAADGDAADGNAADEVSSATRYRTQKRGGKGLRDIKTTERNGPVIGIVRVDDDDEIIMMTARGKLQRIRSNDISVIGRNTQGVRIMSLDVDDLLAVAVRVPKEEVEETEPGAGPPQNTGSSASPDSDNDDGSDSGDDQGEA
jgi:DNA gyrase subunit A